MISRRRFLQNTGLASASLAFGTTGIGHQLKAQDVAAADALYRRSIIIDTLSFGVEWDQEEFDAVKETGYTGIQTSLANRNFAIASRSIAEWRRRIEDNPDKLLLALQASDFVDAKQSGRLAVMLGFQNGRIFESNIDNVDALYHMGTRCVQLTYNFRNLIGNGCLERVDGGLSDYGVEVVERMNQRGIIVDLSHCGVQTTFDGITYSEKPVAFTHTMCQALYPGHPRAKSDAQISALADKGGVMGVTALGYFVGPDPGGETGIEDYVDHIEHCINVAGIEHTALSTDFPVHGISPWATRETWYVPRLTVFKPSYNLRWPPWIPELDATDRFYRVTRILARRGHSEAAIEKILGLNWLRYFEEVIG